MCATLYSHVASATMQISVLCTLARLYVSPGPHQALLRKMIAPPVDAGDGLGGNGNMDGEDSGGTRGAGEGGGRVLALWSACVKYCVRLDARFAASAPISEEEETVSAGVFTGAVEPLLRSSAPLYLSAAAALLNGPHACGRGGVEGIGGGQGGRAEGAFGGDWPVVAEEEVVERTLELVPLAVLLLQRECESSSNFQGSSSSSPVASCALASALRDLLTPRAVALILASAPSKAAALRDMCEVVEHTSLALACTPVHLSVAEAGVDLLLHLAHVAPAHSSFRTSAGPVPGEVVPTGREAVVLERLLTPVVAVLQVLLLLLLLLLLQLDYTAATIT